MQDEKREEDGDERVERRERHDDGGLAVSDGEQEEERAQQAGDARQDPK